MTDDSVADFDRHEQRPSGSPLSRGDSTMSFVRLAMTRRFATTDRKGNGQTPLLFSFHSVLSFFLLSR